MIIALTGPHGVGKTTLGRALAAWLGVPFEGEIGWELAQDPAWRPHGADASSRQVPFDREVFRREIARDLDRADRPIRVVESWHPGNLAYAARRSPGLVDELLPTVQAHVERFPSVVLPLTAARAVLQARQHEPGNLDFFLEVGRDSTAWARTLRCHVLPPISTDPDPQDDDPHPRAQRAPLLELRWTACP